MAFSRLNHTAPGMDEHDPKDIMPIIIIRDPYHWMQSMVRIVCWFWFARLKNVVDIPVDVSTCV